YIACRILSQKGFACLNLSGGYRLYSSVVLRKSKTAICDLTDISLNKNRDEGEKVMKEGIFNEETQTFKAQKITVDACGLQCPGPILELSKALKNANGNDIIEMTVTDPAFLSDSKAFCERTGNTILDVKSSKGVSVVTIQKGSGVQKGTENNRNNDGKNIIVFSGDLDKAIASFIIANAAAAMGRKVSMFFTFWGLNILRRSEKVNVKKDFLSRMFAGMMPRGSAKLKLSNMNMMGMGGKMIRGVMKKKNISSLEELMHTALENGVELVACTMSMDVMGIRQEELIDGVRMGGAAAMLAHAEESDMSLFI
ncbi:pyridine nucleotide-disulfide oxidoreductase, partial [Candidatus Nomurabacteria bacterium]|nr:pyridine nucleotide-disulfide oxidoreductase [Candidatus Nomurabacteria bacterium]